MDVIICPTSREETGLAMSSRNRRLSDEAKNKATIIYKSFAEIKDVVWQNTLDDVKPNSALQNNIIINPEIFIVCRK